MRNVITLCLMAFVVLATLVSIAVISMWPPAIETMSQMTSPNLNWSIVEEYERRPSCYRIILRGTDGKEVARTKDRFVASYLIDLPQDHRSELEITNDTAGTKEHPIWQLDAQNTWQAVSQDEREPSPN